MAKKNPRIHVVRTRLDDETYTRLMAYIDRVSLRDPKLNVCRVAEMAIIQFLYTRDFWEIKPKPECQTVECPFYKLYQFMEEHR